MKTVGDRIQEAAQARGLGFRDLDVAIGKARSSGFTSKIVSGDRKKLEAKILSKYAETLGVDAQWLLDGRGSGPRTDAVECPDDELPFEKLSGWAKAVAEAPLEYPRIPADIWARTARAVLPGRKSVTVDDLLAVALRMLRRDPGGSDADADVTVVHRRELDDHAPSSRITSTPPPHRDPRKGVSRKKARAD